MADPNGRRPALSDEMLLKFTQPADGSYVLEPFRDIERLDRAFYVLFRFRASIGLEAEIAFRRALSIMYIPEETYAMCSKNTKVLASIYVDFMY